MNTPGVALTPPKRVVVVDPNTDNADSLAMLLRLSGVDARAAYSVKVGCQIAGKFRPHVVISETYHVGMNRRELARCLHEAAPQAVLIALTTTGTKSDVAESEAAGFALHLVKADDPERMLTALMTGRQPQGWR